MSEYKCPECGKVVEREYEKDTFISYCTETGKDAIMEKIESED